MREVIWLTMLVHIVKRMRDAGHQWEHYEEAKNREKCGIVTE